MKHHTPPTSSPLLAGIIRKIHILFIWLTRPNPQIQRPEERRQARLLLTLLTAFIVFSGVVAISLVARVALESTPLETFASQLVALLCGDILLVIAYAVARTPHYQIGALLSIVCVMVTCIVAAIGTQEPFALAFLSIGTLIGALFLTPRMTILVTIISVLITPVVKTLFLHRDWRLLSDEVIFLVGISLINLLVVTMRRADLNQIEQQSRELLDAEKRRVELIVQNERAAALRMFINNVSHDFRTPLTVINSSAYLIKHVVDQRQQQIHAIIIEEQTARLSNLIEDMIAVIRLDNPNELNLQPVDINQLAKQAAQTIVPALTSKQLALHLELADRLVPVQADRYALEIAFRELLENAAQYNRNGGSIIVQTAEAPGSIVLRITDTGIGIDEGHLPHIFDLLYRVDKARSTKTGGAGLGLPIVKKIIEAHGGTIAVESVPDQHTTFTITLPRRAAPGE